ncbi:hypothetical protein BURC_03708 [Burkholderiaceae bacterium]|nr:hypothetical protein BURC_03708 [Burkholderiaceae bacterium]
MNTALNIALGVVAGSLLTLGVCYFTMLQPTRAKIEDSRKQLQIDARESRDAASEVYRQNPNLAPAVSKLLTIYANRFDHHADQLP